MNHHFPCKRLCFFADLFMRILQSSLPKSSKASLFLSLLFKAIKGDANNARVLAFVKRLLQVAVGMQPNFTCGCLMLVSEIAKTKRLIFSAILEPEKDGKGDAPGDKEGVQDPSDFHSAEQIRTIGSNSDERDGDDKEMEFNPDEGMLEGLREDGTEDSLDSGEKDASRNALSSDGPEQSGRVLHHPTRPGEGRYDMRKRNPEYSGAERSCLWELNTLADHYHPSVAAMARSLLAGNPVVYDGDPIREFPLSVFLDRFIQKKPKIAKENLKGSSLMQPETLVSKRLTVGSSEFAALAEAEVPPDEVFFHRFFTAKRQAGSEGRKSRNKKRSSEDDGEESSDEDSDDGSESGHELDSEEEEMAWDAAMSGSGSELDEEGVDDVDEDNVYDYSQLARMVEEGSDSGDSLLDDEAVEDLSDNTASDTSDEADGSESEEGEESEHADAPKSRRQKREDGGQVFASVEDYAHLIGADPTSLPPSGTEDEGANKRKRGARGKKDVRKRNKASHHGS